MSLLDQIRARIALIESCQLHVEQLLSALRGGLLRGLARDNPNDPVAYTSSETTKHNFPGIQIKTVKGRYNPNRNSAKNAKGGSSETTPKGWGFSRITITIKGFVIEVFSYVYTYIFLVVFGFLTLYFRHYLNKT